MKNLDLKERKFQVADPIDSYFDCILSCEMKDGICISRCVEILKKYEN